MLKAFLINVLGGIFYGTADFYQVYSRMLRHSCCEVRVMQLHDILQLRTSVILPEAISDGGLAPI